MSDEKNKQPDGAAVREDDDDLICQGPSGGCCRTEGREEPRGKLHSYNWLDDIPGGQADSDLVEVMFKNTRKGFYRNSLNLPLEIGDMVAVESSPGHDIGRVTMIGRLVALQMKKARVKPDSPDIKRVFLSLIHI